MVILSSFDVRLEREISSDTSHITVFQNEDSRDSGGRIRATSSRAVCNAVSVSACCRPVGCPAAREVNEGVEVESVDGDAL